MNLPQALEIVKDHIRIGKGMELTNGVPEALEMAVGELEATQIALKMACNYKLNDCCPVDEVNWTPSKCGGENCTGGECISCWGEYFLSQAREGDR
jgi:hypothetical protein